MVMRSVVRSYGMKPGKVAKTTLVKKDRPKRKP